LSAPPDESVSVPVAIAVERLAASGIFVMRLFTVSATQRRPILGECHAGRRLDEGGLVRPPHEWDPMTVELSICGICPATMETSILTMGAQTDGGVVCRPADLLNAFATKRYAPECVTSAVISHGPLMFGVDQVSAMPPCC